MIDIETLGTTPEACILQVGAVMWDDDGIYDETISFDLSVTEQLNLGRRIDPKTVGWWLDEKVNHEVRRSVLNRSNTVPLYEGMRKLNDYISSASKNKGGITVWANPPQFDISIIRSAMESCGVIPTWQHWEERDLRTLRNICKESGITYDRKNAQHHSALSDAHHQAEEVIMLFHNLKFRLSLPLRQYAGLYSTPNTPNTSSLG